MKQTPATEIFNSHVFDLISHTATKILEIGTGSGSLALAVKNRNPTIEYVGVEISPEYVELSRNRCDRVYLENFEKPTYNLLQEVADKDYIIFSDVLEHFVDPWGVLEMLRATMRPGSKIIASIPNIQHWSVQTRLNLGDWRYTENGLLDKPHVRFFTRETIIELFSKSGFSVIDLIPRVFDFNNQDQALNIIANFTKLLGGDEIQSRKDAATFQYVIVAENITS